MGDPDRAGELLRGAMSGEGRRASAVDSACLIPCAVLFGLLGARGDSAFGRIHLAPRIPSGWSDLEVLGIPLGPARMDLSYHSAGGRRTFRFRPVLGAVPVTVVFEPEIAHEPGAVLLDGEPADVSILPTDGGWTLRCQFPLDRPREMEVDGAAE